MSDVESVFRNVRLLQREGRRSVSMSFERNFALRRGGALVIHRAAGVASGHSTSAGEAVG